MNRLSNEQYELLKTLSKGDAVVSRGEMTSVHRFLLKKGYAHSAVVNDKTYHRFSHLPVSKNDCVFSITEEGREYLATYEYTNVIDKTARTQGWIAIALSLVSLALSIILLLLG